MLVFSLIISSNVKIAVSQKYSALQPDDLLSSPPTMESAIPASIVAVFRLIEFGLSYSEVSKETSELLENLKVIDRKINETKSLRRMKSGWLDTHAKNNIDLDIVAASNILKSIGATIESCRRDLAANNRVTAFNKLRWLFRDNQSFLKQERTLSNCLSALISDITTMQLLNNNTGDLLPPPYDPHHQLLSRGPTLLGPNVRRQLAKQKSSASLASFKTGDDIGGGHVDTQEITVTVTSRSTPKLLATDHSVCPASL